MVGGRLDCSTEDPLLCGLGTCREAALAIEFDVENLIGRLNVIEKSQLPYAGNQALKRFGFLMKSQILPQKFDKEFDAPDGYGKPVPRTLTAFRYEADGLTLKLYPKKDQGKGLSAAEYLRSALYGGEATDTSIHKAIQAITGLYPIPAYGNLKALGALTQRADIKPTYAAKVISGLERNFARKQQPASGERFVASVIGPSRGGFATSARGGLKGNAVYRIKGNSIAAVFTLSSRKTTLEPVFDYEGFVRQEARKRLPSLISLSLQRALESI